MLYTWEVTKRLADDVLLDTRNIGSNTCCQRVIDVVLTGQTQRLLLHIEWLGLFNGVLTSLDITDRTFLLQF